MQAKDQHVQENQNKDTMWTSPKSIKVHNQSLHNEQSKPKNGIKRDNIDVPTQPTRTNLWQQGKLIDGYAPALRVTGL